MGDKLNLTFDFGNFSELSLFHHSVNFWWTLPIFSNINRIFFERASHKSPKRFSKKTFQRKTLKNNFYF